MNIPIQFGRATYVPQEKKQDHEQFHTKAERAASKNLDLSLGDVNPYTAAVAAYLTGDDACFSGDYVEIKANKLSPGDQGAYFLTNTDTPDLTDFFQQKGKEAEKLKSVVEIAKAENRLVTIA